MTLVDLLTLFGGTAATWTYKLYNDNYAPYSFLDVEVLQSTSDPELMSYTWNHDPRTSAVNDDITQIHRLGISDWIPKMHQVALSVFTQVSTDVPVALTSMNYRDQGKNATMAQSFNVLVGVMVRAGYYPFTQVSI